MWHWPVTNEKSSQLNLIRYFQFGPIFKSIKEIHPTVKTRQQFIGFFENGTKLKYPSRFSGKTTHFFGIFEDGTYIKI